MSFGFLKRIPAIFRRIGAFVIIMAVSVGMLAHIKETPRVLGLVIGKSSPTKVQEELLKLSPTSRITVEETIRVEKIRIDGQTYNVEASFDGKLGNRTLSALEMTVVGPSLKKKPSVLNSFTAIKDKRGEFTQDNLLARWSIFAGKETIRIIENPNNPMIERTVEVVKWLAIALCAIVAFFSLSYFWWWIIGGSLGYVLGNGALGLLVGAAVASLHFLIVYFQSPNLTYVSDGFDSNDSGSTYDMNDPMAINPANGLPMIGGQGGIDIHGNTYGSSFNDPFRH